MDPSSKLHTFGQLAVVICLTFGAAQPASSALPNKETPASKVLCAHLQRASDIAVCRSGCTTWPADRICLLIRRFGDLGTAILVDAVKHKRGVEQVAREGKLPAAQGHALMLWADANGMRRVAWRKMPTLTAAQKVELKQAITLRKQAISAYRAHDEGRGLQLLRQAYGRLRKLLGSKHPMTFETAGQSAYMLIRQRKFREAKTILQRLLAQQQALYGRDHPNVASTLQLLGQVALSSLHYAEARDLFGAAMDVAEPVWGKDHPKLRVMWNNLAVALEGLGDQAGYEAAYRKSLEISRRVQGPNHLDTATDLTNLGVLLSERARYAQAQEFLAAGIKIRKANNASANDLAGSYHNLGALQQLNGEFATARCSLETALGYWKKSPDVKSLHRATTLLILGQVLQSLAEFQGAMIAYRKCKDIREKGLKRGHPDTARVYMQMGQLLGNMAERMMLGKERDTVQKQALRLLEAAYGQTRKVLGVAHPDTLRRLAALAGHYTTMKRPLEAAEMLREVIVGLSKTLGQHHPQVAAVWNNLGVALADAGKHEAALKAYATAEKVLIGAVGSWHPDTQAVRVNRARILLKLGKISSAVRMVDGASEQMLAQINAFAGSASSDLALLMQVANLRPLYNAVISAHAAARDAKGGFAHNLRWQGAGTRVEMLWRQLRRAERAADPATRTLLRRYQDQQVALLIARGGVVRPSGSAASASKAASAAKAGAGVGGPAKKGIAIKKRMAAKARMVAKRRTAMKRSATKRIAKDLSRIERKLAASMPSLADRQRRLQPTVKAVCSALKARKSSLVDYVSYGRLPGGEARYGAYVVAPRGCRVRWFDLGSRARVDGLVKAWRTALSKATACFVRRRKARYCKKFFRRIDAAGQALRTQVWKPVAAAVKATKRTWIVPTGALTGVAFDALPDAGSRYLMETRTLGYLPYPAAAVASRSRRRAASRRRSGSKAATLFSVASGAFVLGDLDYAGVQPSPAAAVKDWRVCTKAGCATSSRASQEMNVTLRTASVSRGTAVCGRAANWAPLPPTEAPAVAAWLAKHVADRVWLASGAAASEPALRAALPKKKFIHLATHGFYSDPVACGQPVDQARVDKLLQRSVADGAARPLIDPMAMSGIVLSGANGSGAGADAANDGVLSAREVARMDLGGTELAVLSACETGLGFSGGGEGNLGLSRAFLLAGAAHTVVSLWQVPSKETAQLFETFYANLTQGKHRGDVIGALRAARLDLLHQLKARKLGASAFLWAAFVPFAGGL